ncbi:TPR repeat containing exported protein; Putative periplasmic protein contains a protein prenylyltransferase domain [invertebrate metagenome]|uniref:TPR repeat containing exported protein Putative periplasmic protein contains a protein prenylyltransferase domain n=1 Tax=invertebrate metagenome TaxID=1711999 RepID=A0A484H9L4_9ZZZZ
MRRQFARSSRTRWLASGVIVLATFGSLLSQVISAQESSENLGFDTFSQRIDRLERDLNAIQLLFRRGRAREALSFFGGSSRSSALEREVLSRLQQRMSDIEDIAASLTGQVEEMRFELGRIHNQLGQIVSDVCFTALEQRLNNGSKHTMAQSSPRGQDVQQELGTSLKTPGWRKLVEGEAVASAAEVSQKKSGHSTLSPLQGSAKERYEAISTLLSLGDYATAEQALLAFLEAYPSNPLTSNAQYWLGETYYMRGDFRQAAIAFAKGYQKYARSSQSPAHVLKLGMALAQLGQTKSACSTFTRLATEFPHMKRRADLEKAQRCQ